MAKVAKRLESESFTSKSSAFPSTAHPRASPEEEVQVPVRLEEQGVEREPQPGASTVGDPGVALVLHHR